METQRVKLTENRVRDIQPAAQEFVVWDSEIGGFGLRVYPSGLKRYVFHCRAGAGGRKAPQRRITLGSADVGGPLPAQRSKPLRLEDARAAAREHIQRLAAGHDPRADLDRAAHLQATKLDVLLDTYERHLQDRKVVNQKAIMSLLRRELLGPLGKTKQGGDIRRRDVAERVERLIAAGKPGAAQDLRAKATTFFGWAVNRDLLYANPLAGWRRDRATRAQMAVRPGKSLSADELGAVWRACSEVPAPFGDFVRFLLLTGQRRKETSIMRRPDVDLEAGIWTIPARHAKNGHEHRVPLPPLAVAILRRQRRWDSDPHVFATGTRKPMSGWTKRQNKLIEVSGVDFTLHDCRRTFRSGLTALQVETELAEIMLNHVKSDLIARYDREPRWRERMAAATSWAEHVSSLVVEGEEADVVDLASRIAS